MRGMCGRAGAALLVLAAGVAVSGCGEDAGPDPLAPTAGEVERLVAVPGTPGRLHMQLHLEGLAAADEMMFALGDLEVRAPGGALVARVSEALSLYIPATAGGIVDHSFDVSVEPMLLPGRYEVSLAVTDVLSDRRTLLRSPVELSWPMPAVPSGFGVRIVDAITPLAGVPGEEITVHCEAFGFRLVPGDVDVAVWLDTELTLVDSTDRPVVRSHQGTYRLAGPVARPLVELRYRIRVPADAPPGAYQMRLAVHDRLGDYRSELVTPLTIGAAAMRVGPPRWREGGPDMMLEVRTPTDPEAERLALGVRVVGTDGTVVAETRREVAPGPLEAGLLMEGRVDVTLPPGVPATPLLLEADLAPAGTTDRDGVVVSGSWPLVRPASPPPATAAPTLVLEPVVPSMVAGGALPFRLSLSRPPAPLASADSPVRELRVDFALRVEDATGRRIASANSTVSADLPFVPGVARVSGVWVADSELAAGTYALVATARAASAKETWTTKATVVVVR